MLNPFEVSDHAFVHNNTIRSPSNLQHRLGLELGDGIQRRVWNKNLATRQSDALDEGLNRYLFEALGRKLLLGQTILEQFGTELVVGGVLLLAGQAGGALPILAVQKGEEIIILREILRSWSRRR